MNMHPVDSEEIISIGYSQSKQELHVELSTSTNAYLNVPSYIFQGLMSAASKGEYYNVYIENSFEHRQVTEA
ncbi:MULTISPECIES: KTSC domain-containing protein [Brochothrix]|uniref:KTSC domain-containing protein n=1 Tax=Brochothrix thermosphacta TaxID=2756 RepID=A0A1D2KHW1_BROTH|nr:MULTISPECIES: KTSC domain-containing protein [Brochothrix]SLM90615.1 hypothetical protein FM106_02080 [Brachybacterium faecium]ANZ93957.1 hypothetical protein BFC19_00205 [Brochothrix thermosphacta]ANZ97743.1 hypothetical protein BFC20_08560 [Brochothrix thermosphacta]ATF24905.1 KTSC domain-containing protein [Brochothrix thermosphacta]ATH84320.1 KTSC domain-containing protein [Brochothrix thermosphacta]